jgi:uncharacterized membrane protein
MKKILFIILIISPLLGICQGNKEITKPKSKEFRYPVIVKLIQGEGNVFRIGFIRYNDFFDVKENESEIDAFYARFLTDFELKNSVFVYFPTANQNGEMLVVPKVSVTKIDMTYEQAMQIIVPE